MADLVPHISQATRGVSQRSQPRRHSKPSRHHSQSSHPRQVPSWAHNRSLHDLRVLLVHRLPMLYTRFTDKQGEGGTITPSKSNLWLILTASTNPAGLKGVILLMHVTSPLPGDEIVTKPPLTKAIGQRFGAWDSIQAIN